MSRITIPLPPLSEQHAIADFLDRETAKIDAMIAKQTTLIELLKERRAAAITAAVTNDQWQNISLHHLVRFNNGQDYTAVEDPEGEIPVYGSGGPFTTVNSYLYDGESVLFGRKGTIDKPLHVHGKFWTIDTMFYTALGPKICGRWLYYWATTVPFGLYSTNTALPSMTSGVLGRLKLSLPPLSEQRAIADHLDDVTAKIDTLIAKAEESIALSQERRAALITAAVTGQIDVTSKEA